MMGRRRARARRRLKAASVAGPLLAGAIITVSATPALASPGITSPSPGATVTGGSSVLVAAEVDGLAASGELKLRRPSAGGFTTVDSGHGTLSHRLDLRGSNPAPNGTYTVRLKAGLLGILQGTAGERSFTVRVPPRQPTGVSASVRSARQVRVQWNRGAEPDLASYDVLTASGRMLRAGLPVEKICGATLCGTTLTVPASAGSGTIGLAVRAHRHTAPSSSDTVASGVSGAAEVVIAGSSPSPSPSISASGSSPSPSPSMRASGEASPSPELTPLSSNSPSKEAEAAGESPVGLPHIGPGGTQNPGFSGPLPRLPSEEPPGGGAASGPGTTWTAVTGAAERWKTAAVIVIVLLVAAHLGGLHWRGRSRPAGARPPRRRGAQPAAATAGPTYLGAEGKTKTEPTRRRSTRPLRRVRSLLGTYRGSRRAL